MIDTSAVQNRAQGILSWLYDVTGVLYFRIDERLPQAWDANGLYAFGGNGDGTLVYPGKPSIIGGSTHIPLASMRLKALRDGFEDYEFMKLVADLGDPAFARYVGEALFPRAFSSRQSAESLYATREALAERILVLRGQPNLRVSKLTGRAVAAAGAPYGLRTPRRIPVQARQANPQRCSIFPQMPAGMPLTFDSSLSMDVRCPDSLRTRPALARQSSRFRHRLGRAGTFSLPGPTAAMPSWNPTKRTTRSPGLCTSVRTWPSSLSPLLPT